MFKAINGYNRAKIIAQIKLRNNGTRAVNDFGSCLYRASNGNVCFAGAFIPDDKYSASFENGTINAGELEPVICHMPLELDGMIKLQRVHDFYGTNYEERPSEGRSLHETMEKWVNENVLD